MIISLLKTDEYLYINLHAEEVVTANFIREDKTGIFVDRLQIETILRIKNELNLTTPHNIFLDFKYISACQPNLNSQLTELKENGHSIAFLNINKKLCNELHFNIVKNPKNKATSETFNVFYFFEGESNPMTEILPEIEKAYKSKFLELLKKHSITHHKPHTSSFIYLSVFINMKSFISLDFSFTLYALYKIAQKTITHFPQLPKELPVLICQSLNSSFLASILSTLLNLDILMLDKIGPINKLYGRINNSINSGSKYIIVSDLVCLGTEVKIVKNLIQFAGGICLGNISLVKTETIKRSDIKKENATIAAFSITNKNNAELNYYITTDLSTQP